MWRIIMIGLTVIGIVCLIRVTGTIPAQAKDDPHADDTEAIIIEVKGDPQKHKAYIASHYPSIEIVQTYHSLFNGIALRGDPKKMMKIHKLDFIKSIHSVKQYDVSESHASRLFKHRNQIGDGHVLPNDLNDSHYTGKGVKVGVIDTGIDYTHPDLAANYKQGYDLVDLDDDPMETKADQGQPTLHGTHVAGIIAANGKIKGVAPNAEIYAYRALGPGGKGSSVQVLAALEQAVKDKVDIVNLSLGNTVNGPDYPTSVAVNRAVKKGVAVVIANGNAGPGNWTVGAPATADKAFSVGAVSLPQEVPSLYEPKANKTVDLTVMQGSPVWDLQKDYPLEIMTQKNHDLHGKIALIKRGKIPFYQKAKQAEKLGAVAVVIYNHERGRFQGSIENKANPVSIPVAAISKRAGTWLKEESKQAEHPLYMQTTYKKSTTQVAKFSSRGPVTVDWHIKPDVTAPGVSIVSTVPGGYQSLQGTSMAAPHIAGVLALMKEAHPNWSVQKLEDAVKTTAKPLNEGKKRALPIKQGMGEARPKAAIQTPTILHHSLLSFGKLTGFDRHRTLKIVVENTTNRTQDYAFSMPKQEKGVRFRLPQSFSVGAKKKKTINVDLNLTTQRIHKGVHQGWLKLNGPKRTYHLPYLFVNQSANYPKAMGLDVSLKPLSQDRYHYQVYLTDQVKRVDVQLFDDASLIYKRTLLTIDDPKTGMNEGEIEKRDIGPSGTYKAMVTLEFADGHYENVETALQIDARN